LADIYLCGTVWASDGGLVVHLCFLFLCKSRILYSFL